MKKVVENLQNPNTPYKNSREITIKMKFTQNEQRDDVNCAIQVSEKLAPQAPMETRFAVGKDLATGQMYAEEYGKQIRGQMSVNDYQAKPVEVDTETGEILDKKQGAQIIDFRTAAK